MGKNKAPHPTAKAATPAATQTPISINSAEVVAQLGIDLPSVKALLSDLEHERGSRVVSLVYTASDKIMLQASLLPNLEHVLTTLGKVPALDLFLRSTGGVTEIPWRVISLLREFSDKLGVVVSKFAFSGACHIAIAADDLVMTPFAVLGSV